MDYLVVPIELKIKTTYHIKPTLLGYINLGTKFNENNIFSKNDTMITINNEFYDKDNNKLYSIITHSTNPLLINKKVTISHSSFNYNLESKVNKKIKINKYYIIKKI